MSTQEAEDGKVRLSGQTSAQEAAEEASAALTDPLDPDVLPEERDREFEPTYQRMRFDWRAEDLAVTERIISVVDARVHALFPDAYEVLFQVFDAVRTQVPGGAVDQYGWPEWVRLPNGAYDEDWSRLSTRQRGDLLMQITTHLFEWERRAADLWGGALFAKGRWSEAFAAAFDGVVKGTDAVRTQRATRASIEDKYFAMLQAYLSRRAESLVRSMDRIALRLRDTMS